MLRSKLPEILTMEKRDFHKHIIHSQIIYLVFVKLSQVNIHFDKVLTSVEVNVNQIDLIKLHLGRRDQNKQWFILYNKNKFN